MKSIVLMLSLCLLSLLPGASNAWGKLNSPPGAAVQREGSPTGPVVDITGIHKHVVQGDPETREYLTANVWQCQEGQRSVFGYAVHVLPPAETSPYKSFLDPDAAVTVENGKATFAGTISYNQHLAIYEGVVKIDPTRTFSLTVKDAADGTVLLVREGAFDLPRRAGTISSPN